MSPAIDRGEALCPGVVLELCGDSVDGRIPAQQRSLDVFELLSSSDGDAVVVGKAKQPELHKKCISKDSLPFVAGEHFRIWHDGKAFQVISTTSKPMWVEPPLDPEDMPTQAFPGDAQPLTEVTEDEPVPLPMDGHIVLSVGASNLWPGDLARRLRWRLCNPSQPAAAPKDPEPKPQERIVAKGAKSAKSPKPDPDSDAENRCDFNGQERQRRPTPPTTIGGLSPAPIHIDLPKNGALVAAQPVPGKYCFYCHSGLPAEEGCKLGGRWFCSLDHHLVFLHHGRRPLRDKEPRRDCAADVDPPAAMSVASVAPTTPWKQRRCSQPMSGTLGKRRPGGTSVTGAHPQGCGGSLPSKKLQATPEQLLNKEQWFGPRGVQVALMCRGVTKCILRARRVWMLKTLLEHAGDKLGVASSDLSLQASGAAGELFERRVLLGDVMPLQDSVCSFELLWSAGCVNDLPTVQVTPRAMGVAELVTASVGTTTASALRSGEVDIRARGLGGGEVVSVLMPRSRNVSHLKNEIAKRKKIAPWEMKLVAGEVILDDADSIDARFPGEVAEVTLVKLTDWPDDIRPEEEMRLFEVVAPHMPTTPSGMELELRPGERLCVVEQDASGWWGGYRLHDGPEVLGWFPGNCVRRVVC
mmetsp:Transcript_35685/g.101727  ORF Transcript_35685/g.101727 Transcript_35685/m.101727 type:complete len:639 (-) Transcript_35685:102-2018(-)